ncbi:hypothetical protein QBC32DRAFT_320088 [Pseudoneurospora amorphoporcata]|uniref:Uncharacterized protein n=1 Tax=Pseudoneurospora amorphoporcata TaxID=241081 RepID=A0AAN6SB59_9PEZI|nr:hypothetical protein QBC32DRAFT_320088 [Pseudoneurospora amorphoporcata]
MAAPVTDFDVAISAINAIVGSEHEQLFENITESLNGAAHQHPGNPVAEEILSAAPELAQHAAFPHVIIALAQLVHADLVQANTFVGAAQDSLETAHQQIANQDNAITSLQHEKTAETQIRALKKAIRNKITTPASVPVPNSNNEATMATPKTRTNKDPATYTGEDASAVKRAEAFQDWRDKIQLCWF